MCRDLGNVRYAYALASMLWHEEEETEASKLRPANRTDSTESMCLQQPCNCVHVVNSIKDITVMLLGLLACMPRTRSNTASNSQSRNSPTCKPAMT